MLVHWTFGFLAWPARTTDEICLNVFFQQPLSSCPNDTLLFLWACVSVLLLKSLSRISPKILLSKT